MNHLEIRFSALLENVGFARTSVASFISSLNPTIDEIQEIRLVSIGARYRGRARVRRDAKRGEKHVVQPYFGH